MMYLGVCKVFLFVCLAYILCEVVWAPWISDLLSFIIFGKFLAISFSNNFSATLSFSYPPGNSNFKYVIMFNTVLALLDALFSCCYCHCFILLSLWIVVWIISIDRSSS